MKHKLLANKQVLFSFISLSLICILELILAIIYSTFNISLIWNSFHKLAFFLAMIFLFILACSVRSIIIRFICIIIFLISSLLYSVSDTTRNLYFSSPNGKSTLIAVESNHVSGHSYHFFVKKNLIFKEELDNYYIISYLYPFEGNSCNINWLNDDEVDFTFNLDNVLYFETIENNVVTFHLNSEFEGKLPVVKDIKFKVNLNNTSKLR